MPTNPLMVLTRVHARRVCPTVMPEKREMTQNPESLGNEQHMLPQQIASPTVMGLAPATAIMGATMDDVVTAATVAEP